MNGRCNKCFQETLIDEHHLHPKFMDNPHGFAFKDFVSRVWLCREHHKFIHSDIIAPILQTESSLDYISEYYLWKNIPKEKKNKTIEDVVVSSWLWLQTKGDKKDGDTQKTTN